MKIERYTNVMVVLALGLMIAGASWPEAAFAEAQTSTAPTCVQCSAPVNAWCVPATAGAGVAGTFCTTSAPSVQVSAPARSACPPVEPGESALEALGTIVAAPFVLAQCILVGCP